MFRDTIPGIDGHIIALATLITAVSGVVAILVQNHKQHKKGALTNAHKIEEATTKLAARFDTHAAESAGRDKKLAKGLTVLKQDSDVLFGMIVNVDAKVDGFVKEFRPAVAGGE